MHTKNKLRGWRRPRIAITNNVSQSNTVQKAIYLRRMRAHNRRIREQKRRIQKVVTSSQPRNKWIVLLTTCVKTPSNSLDDQEYRTTLYKTQIQKWLNNTNYEIVVVESSGCNSFSELESNKRLHVYTTIITNCGSSSQSEASSMLYVLDQIKNEDFYIHCTHILKVTGRYYLQNIEHILDNYPLQNMNMYVQQRKHRSIREQNTEYYGIKKDLLTDFLEPVVFTGLMEKRLYEFIDMKRMVCILPSFPNNIARGGDGLILNPL